MLQQPWQWENPVMVKHPQDCPKEKHLFLHRITNASLCSHLEGLLQMKSNWIQTRWTQRSQSANIYPNLIALSALAEKKDAKVRVDISRFAVQRARKWKRGGCKIVAKSSPILLAFKSYVLGRELYGCNKFSTEWKETQTRRSPDCSSFPHYNYPKEKHLWT